MPSLIMFDKRALHMNKTINAYIYHACVSTSASAVVYTQRVKSKCERNMRIDVSASADAHVDTQL